MTLYYLLMLTIVALVVYAGYDETMKLFIYADLQVRHAYVRIQMKFMAWKLKRQLIEDTTDFKKFISEYTNDK